MEKDEEVAQGGGGFRLPRHRLVGENHERGDGGVETKPSAALREFLILLQPFAPHLAEELWARLTAHSAFRIPHSALPYAPWPRFDPALLVEDTLEIPVQVNGKLRGRITVPAAATQAEIESAALACDTAQAFLTGKAVKKIIVVPKKLVNLVVA